MVTKMRHFRELVPLREPNELSGPIRTGGMEQRFLIASQREAKYGAAR
jgi:hypothetical protein